MRPSVESEWLNVGCEGVLVGSIRSRFQPWTGHQAVTSESAFRANKRVFWGSHEVTHAQLTAYTPPRPTVQHPAYQAPPYSTPPSTPRPLAPPPFSFPFSTRLPSSASFLHSPLTTHPFLQHSPLHILTHTYTHSIPCTTHYPPFTPLGTLHRSSVVELVPPATALRLPL